MPISTNKVFPPNSTSNPGYRRFTTFPTLADIKKDFLHGVDLKDDKGNEFPDSVIESYVFAAISEVEHQLNITVTPTQYTDKKDYIDTDYQNFGFIKLDHRPIIYDKTSYPITISVNLIKDSTVINFPDEWIRVYSASGQIHITPTTGTLGTFNISQSGFLPQIFSVKRDYPQLFTITYTAGFENSKVPYMIYRLIGLLTAIKLLAVAGELVLGAGIANQSISLDGLSQSIGSTASAMYGAYAARIEVYNKEISTLYKIADNFYNGGLRFQVS